jgi:uncharacterized protein (DUF1800 family)
MPFADSWTLYTPDDKSPWNLRRAVHLHRRTGFAATWSEIQRDLKDGPKASVDRVLSGKAATEGVPEKFEETANLLGESAASSRDPARLKAWWVYRMMFGPDPLTERLALMWHNHFATSNLKVENLSLMRGQNSVFRKLGRKHFGELLNAVARDPATLMWLDAPANRKGQPNENLARELMELFSMGVGNYTEADVKEAARALTGWTVTDDAFAENPKAHDDGEKTILGKKGNWKGADLVKMVLEHPATSNRIAGRICEQFLGEKARKSADVDALAKGLRACDLDIAWAVETVVRSQLFFADDNIGNRVLSPVEFVLAPARAFELYGDNPSSTLVLGEWCGRLGQDLFYPPNVGGWPGGRSWLTTRAVVGRANYAAALIDGILVGRKGPMDAVALAKQRGEDDVIPFYTRLLFGVEPTPEWRQRITSGVTADNGGDRARRIVALMLAMPEAQTG